MQRIYMFYFCHMHINYVNQCNEIPVWQYLRIGRVRGPRLIGIGIGLEI